MNKLEKNYNNLYNFYKKNGKIDIDKDLVYSNFAECLYDEMRNEPYYDFDLFQSAIENHFEDFESKEEISCQEKISILKGDIIKYFEINKDVHYLVCPIQKSLLSQDIVIGNVILLKKRKNDEEYIDIISSQTDLSKENVISLLEHTQKSRSKDFLKDNMIIVKIDDQTSTVKRRGYDNIKNIFEYIRIIYFSKELETSILHTHKVYMYQKNEHIAILSNDRWREGHCHQWNSDLSLNMNIDFMNEKNSQDLLLNMVNEFTTYKKDEVSYTFYNAIELFSRAFSYSQFDEDVATLLLLTVAESLLTQGKNEKRIRLSVIIPRIVTLSKYSQMELAILMKEFYENRNNFVHAGETSSFVNDKKITLLFQCVAKLILYYFDFNQSASSSSLEKRKKLWENHVNSIFENAIYKD